MSHAASHVVSHSDTCVIIQARNAEGTILHVLSQIVRSHVGCCIVVANGCRDKTTLLASSFFKRFPGIGRVVAFSEPLGPDVGKAVGTYAALRHPAFSAGWFTYVDSDWKGGFGPDLDSFLSEAKHKQADVLFIGRKETFEHSRFNRREDVWLWEQALSEQKELQGMSVSESPVAVNKRVFTFIAPYWLYHPGLFAARCLQQKPPLRLEVSRAWSPQFSGNPTKSASHQRKMLDTLVGDAVEGLAVLTGQPTGRRWRGKEHIGYHQDRRVDLLREYMESFQLPL
ncbi:hypothetical protein [Alicyclobacillus sp. SO9]|uniref:hypothetical protein n=1 Tax=Alicyclobacillus sp. SO9 TaxID=2665646 RepID=UPI0018E6F09B|nr:hypothetical protein [Alicyclobacillus sp. SO9]QQE79394.1 hypothetical protein GI364_02505 [Alicyclobacillus sp. SO9]